MNSKILVHEGFTNNYLIPGILGFIVGVILSVILHYKGFPQFFPFVGAPIIGISLIMVSGTNGLEIDLDKEDLDGPIDLVTPISPVSSQFY